MHNLPFTREISYSYALFDANLNLLHSRRHHISKSFFQDICDPSACIHHLLIQKRIYTKKHSLALDITLKFILRIIFRHFECRSSECASSIGGAEYKTPRNNIHELAIAILQVEQMVESKYLNPPLGTRTRLFCLVRLPGTLVPKAFCFSLDVFYLFLSRHRISELRRPIAAKLCTVISICVNFLMQVQKLGASSPKNFYPR